MISKDTLSTTIFLRKINPNIQHKHVFTWMFTVNNKQFQC